MVSVRTEAGSGRQPARSIGLRLLSGRVMDHGRRAWTLLRGPGLAGRCLRVVRREWSAGGLRGLVSYVRRLAAADAGIDSTEISYPEWIALCDTLTDADRAAIRRHVAALSYRPLVSVVVPVYNTAEPLLRAMIASVQAQLYTDWELCLADDASPSPHVARVLAEYAAADPRVKWVRREANGHICAASNSALALARGEFVALLDHDDLLSERALYEVVVALNADPDADLVYSDEDKLDEDGERYGPYFKPDFSHDLLLGQNVISHFGVYRRSAIEAIGGFREGYEGSQDYDLALRVVDHSGAAKVRHVPSILYHWRQERAGGSFSQSQLDRCILMARRAIQDHLDRAAASGADGAGHVAPNPLVPTWSRVKWALPDPAPLVSVIVSAAGGPDLLEASVAGLLERTDYPRIEVLVSGGDWRGAGLAAPADGRVRVLDHEEAAGRAESINLAARAASGDVLLLLDGAVDVVSPDWLSELVALVARPGVGVAGARLLRPDGRIHDAGVRLDAGEAGDGVVARLLGRLRWGTDPGYFGHYVLVRDVSAVTGACLAVRRDVFERVGGLDADNLTRAFHDVDLCLKVREAGYRVLWTPFATLGHRGADPWAVPSDGDGGDSRRIVRRRGAGLAGEPFYNVNFDSGAGDYRLAASPRRLPSWSQWLGSGP